MSFTDVLAGGALSKLAIGGFGVTSLIMAGIVIQLLALIAPKIEKLHGQGEMGRRFFDRLTLILAMLFTLGFQSLRFGLQWQHMGLVFILRYL